MPLAVLLARLAQRADADNEIVPRIVNHLPERPRHLAGSMHQLWVVVLVSLGAQARVGRRAMLRRLPMPVNVSRQPVVIVVVVSEVLARGMVLLTARRGMQRPLFCESLGHCGRVHHGRISQGRQDG